MSNPINQQPPRRYAQVGLHLFIFLLGGGFMAYLCANVLMFFVWPAIHALHGDHSIHHLAPIAIPILSVIIAFFVCLGNLDSFARDLVYGEEPNV